jgi:hypothetical protein
MRISVARKSDERAMNRREQPSQTRKTSISRRLAARIRCAVLAAAITMVAAATGRAQTTSSLQAEIERLRIVVEVKQDRIEALERELADFRRQTKTSRDRKIVADIAREVERLRELRAKRPIEATPLTPAVLDKLLEKEIGDRYSDEQFRGWELMLKHLGLIPEAMELRLFIRALYAEQIAGIYDDDTKKLYVSDKFDLENTMAKVILAHEICHALQDQNFNLTSSPLHLKDNDDREAAALSVVEGDATILMADYLRENASWRLLLELPGLMTMDQKVLASAPKYVNDSLVFPYLQGMTFVMHFMIEWGPEARDRLLRNLPRSTEQILHPEKYAGSQKDEPTDIALDTVTSSSLFPAGNHYSNVAGEAGVRFALAERLPEEQAETAAEGWDGDRIVFGGRPDGDYALAWLSIWDSNNDAWEFEMALKRYFKAQRPELAEQADKGEGVTWLADKIGSIAIVRKGDRVACVHSNDDKRTAGLLDAVLSIRVKKVP